MFGQFKLNLKKKLKKTMYSTKVLAKYFVIVLVLLTWCFSCCYGGDVNNVSQQDFESKSNGPGGFDSDLSDTMTVIVVISLFAIFFILLCLCRWYRRRTDRRREEERLQIPPAPMSHYPHYRPHHQGPTTTTVVPAVYNNESPPYPGQVIGPIYHIRPSPFREEPPPSYYDVTRSTNQNLAPQIPSGQQIGERLNPS